MRRWRPQPAAPPTSSCPAHVFRPQRHCWPRPSAGRAAACWPRSRLPTALPPAGHSLICWLHCPLRAASPRALPTTPSKATPRMATPSCRFLQVTLPWTPPAQRAHGETKARRSGGAGLRAGARRRTDPALAVLTRTHTPPRRPAPPPPRPGPRPGHSPARAAQGPAEQGAEDDANAEAQTQPAQGRGPLLRRRQVRDGHLGGYGVGRGC